MAFWWILLTSLWIQGDADPTISTSTPTPCYGGVVTLVCHHPEVASNPGRYFSTGPAWREDGVGITPSTGVYLQADTSEDLTRTTLTINITVDHFRNKSFNYSCLLVLAENGLPTGEVEASENVTVDPVDNPKAPNVTSPPRNSMMKWTHDNSCYSHHTFGFILTWTKMVDPPDPPSSGSNMTTATQYDFSSLPRGEYSVSIRAQCMENTSIESDVTSARISLTAPVSSPGTTTPPPTDPLGDQTTTIIAVVVVVLVLVVIAVLIIVGFVCVCVHFKKPKTSPTCEPGGVSQNPPKDNLYGKVAYAELEHSQYRPVAAPSQGSVEYTSAVQVGKHPPRAVLPSFKGAPEKDDKEFCRQDSNKSDEFKIQVVTVLRQVVRAPRTSGENVLGNYKQATFVAIFVYIEEESQNVSEEDVEKVAIAKSRHRTDKGLLFSNTEFIQSSLIGKLEKNGCHFISLRTSDKEEVTEEMLMKKFDLFFT